MSVVISTIGEMLTTMWQSSLCALKKSEGFHTMLLHAL